MEGRPSSPRTPDGMLAMSARSGDLQAFGELYHRHSRPIYDFLLRTLHDPTVAADLTQSTFRRAFGRLAGLHDPDRVRAWLFTIAYHLAANQIRRGPVPAMLDEPPRATVALGPAQPGSVEQLDSTELVWTAANSLAPELYAALDLTARQGVDIVELADDGRMTRIDAITLLERAHDSFGSAVRDLMAGHSEEWCPGLATLVQGAETLGAEQAQAVDEHLGRCPRCRPLAERLTSTAAFADLGVFELPHELAQEGWDQLVADLTRASPRLAQGTVVESPSYQASPLAALDKPATPVGHRTYHASGAQALRAPEPQSMSRHASVRRYQARAERAQARRTMGAVALGAVIVAAAVGGYIALTHHSTPVATGTTLPTPTPGVPSTTVHAGSSSPSTTQPHRTTTTVKRATTTTAKPTTTTTATTLPLPVPSTTSISPSSGYPGAVVVVNGGNFASGDFVAFTGPTYPGQTELLTPITLSPNSATSDVPSFASFAGQKIVVSVRNSTGQFNGSVEFLVLAYYTGNWTTSGGKVNLTPTHAAHTTTKDGQINLFATDVEVDQCMVNASFPVYTATNGGPPIAVVTKNAGCPAAEFAISSH